MYTITNATLQKLKDGDLQSVTITVTPTTGTSFTLTSADIVEGSFELSRTSVTGETIEIGSAIASELSFTLNNYEGTFNSKAFEGAELYVSLTVGTATIPLGYFTVDNSPRKLERIPITALDRMVMLDRTVDDSLFTFPCSISTLLATVCSSTNITLGDVTGMVNTSYLVNAMPVVENLTYRMLVQWIAEISGTCAYFDWLGHLSLKWYTTTTTTITKADRYDSDLNESAVTITGVSATVGDTTYVAGTADYALNIENNLLLTDNVQTVVSTLNTARGGFSYTPFSATTYPMPHVYPLDVITFTDKDDNDVTSIITDVHYILNGSTNLQGKGKTTILEGYATLDPFTSRERAIIEVVASQAASERVDQRTAAIIDLNGTIANSMGLYQTAITQPDQSVKYYYHNAATLEGSTFIVTGTGSGFAMTNDWNDGDPVWQYGVTAAGNAVLNTLSVNGLNAGWINTGILSVNDGDGNEVFRADMDTGTVTFNASAVVVNDNDQTLTDLIGASEERSAASIQASADGILTEVSNTYFSKREAGELSSSVTSQINQSASELTASFTNSLQNQENNLNTTNELLNSLSVWFRVTINGAEIGRSDSPLISRYRNDEVGFYFNEVLKAYFRYNSFALKEMQSFILENFAIVKQPNGSYSFVAASEL